MVSRLGISGRSRSMEDCTALRCRTSGDSSIACADSSCSAWENRSIATQSAGVCPSEITRISEGPASMSIPTCPNTCRFASAT